MQTEKKVLDQVSDTSRIYEAGFHLVPMIPLEQVANHAAEIKALVEKNKGVVISEGMPVLTDLAYEISTMIDGTKHRCSSAYFGWIKFECEAEQSLAIEKALMADKNILRFLLVKTVRENTMIDKKLFMEDESEEAEMPKAAEAAKPEAVAVPAKEEAKKEEPKAAKPKKEAKPKASVEDMDKSIDSLLG